MSKASGSIDLKSLKVAGEGASKYITEITGDGIRVHDVNTINNSVVINSEGMEIFKGGTTSQYSIAKYGDTVRIGEKDGANIAIASSNLSGYGAGHREFFNFGDSENTMTTTRYRGWSRRPVSEYPYTDDDAFSASVPASSALSRLEVTFAFTTAGIDARIEFTPGTEATKTVTAQYNNVSYTFSAYYNGIDRVSSIKLTSRHTEQGVSIGTNIVYDETIIAPYYELGVNVDATGNIAYAEGFETIAGGDYSHAEGNRSEASGVGSHAEGSATIADGNYSHAEGILSRANSSYSHASGMYVIANGRSQTVIGEYNEADTLNKVARSANAFIIGNGSDNLNRSNALEVDWSGNVTAAGQYQSLYKITTVTKTLSSGISANSYVSAADITMTAQTGYNAVGIVGHASTNFRIQPTTNYVASNTAIYAGFSNLSDSNVTSSVTVTFYVLWLKATAG